MKNFIRLQLSLFMTLCLQSVSSKHLIDPIKFTLSTNETHIELNREFEITITAEYMTIPSNTAFILEGSNSFNLKLVLPDGFVRTGGDFQDFTRALLNENNPKATYTIKGKFTTNESDGIFQLLRSHKNADNQSAFVAAGKISFRTQKNLVNNEANEEARVLVPSAGFVPYLDIAQLRSGFADTARVVAITDGLRSGIFVYDPNDIISGDDGAMTITNNSNNYRYKRLYQEFINPKWFGAVGDGVNDDKLHVQAAATFSGLNKKTLLIESGFTYMLSGSINIPCNMSGFGTLNTRNGAELVIANSNLTVRNVRVTGALSGIASGKSFRVTNKENITFINVRVDVVSGSGIWFYNCIYPRVEGSRIKHTRHEYGDGIYFGACMNPVAVNNVVEDFQRIGIAGDENCTYALVSGNVTKNAYPKIVGQFNAGIYFEKIKGAIITNNFSENTLDRGILCVPATIATAGKTYTYNISGNTMIGANVGCAFVSSDDQVLSFDNNTVMDCNTMVEIGRSDLVMISNCTFALRDSLSQSVNSVIRYVPTVLAGKSTILKISNCVNKIGGNVLPIFISNDPAHKGDILVNDCTGNWAFSLQPVTLEGDIIYSNTMCDFTVLGASQRYISNNFNTKFSNCQIKINSTNNLYVQGTKVEFQECDIFSDQSAMFRFSTYGSTDVRFEDCHLNRIRFNTINKAGTKFVLVGNEFKDYESGGIFDNVIVAFGNLEVKGNTFVSSLTTNAPIQLPNGVISSSFGVNSYSSATQVTGFLPKFEYSVTLSNSSISAPSKSALNTSYGKQKAGTIVTYPSITGGGRDYIKMTDSLTSDWLGTIWATGIKSTTP